MKSLPTQEQMLTQATLTQAGKFEAFLHIQNGPCPLTEVEMRTLITLRPSTYSFLVKWLP